MKEVLSNMKYPLYTIPLYLALAFSLLSCHVHEWPEETGERYDFFLNMNFDTELPLHKEVYYTRGGSSEDSRGEESQYDIRYIVNVYNVANENDDNRIIWETYTFSREYASNHNYQIKLKLPEGRYRFRVWSDHVKTGTQDDHFYHTVDFTEIYLNENDGHYGSNEFRDAFKGSSYSEIFDPDLYYERNGFLPSNSVTVDMKRPMGRYEFLATDMDEFLDKAIENMDATRQAEIIENARSRGDHDTKGDPFWNGLTRDEVAEAIGLKDYDVVFSYNAFMPSSYNHYTDKPSDSSTGITYQSKMQVTGNGMQLGFDYILVDDLTTMNLNMAVYNKEGTLVASTSGVEVPIARSKNTLVKGAFLTVSSGGGVSINPDFEGPDFDIEIK